MRGGGRPWGRAVALAAALVSLSSAPTVAHAASVERIRSATGADYTRIIIDVSEPVHFRWGTAKPDPKRNLPPRFYVDLAGVRLQRGRDVGIGVGDARVARVRAGQFTNQTARIVLDLTSGSVVPKVSSLESPRRIVIDVTGAGDPTAVRRLPQRVEAAARAPAGRSSSAVRESASTARSGSRRAPASASSASTGVRPGITRPPTPPSRAVPVIASAGARGGSRAQTTTPSGRRRAAASARLQASGARKLRVVIDPGHGGKDPGAKGYHGAREKDAVLEIARSLAEKLSSRLDVEVYTTRKSDKFVPLSVRKDLANGMDADLFVSIHANASKNRHLYGIETYYLKNTNDRATLRLAKLENGVSMLIKGADVSTDADLSYILSDMVQGQKEADSVLLADHVQHEIVSHLKGRYSNVRSLGVKQGPFMVLDGTYMPAILVETGFITNNTEGKRLTSAAYREAVAEGLYRGIKAYLQDGRIGGSR